MSVRVYPYLGEISIAVNASEGLLNRLEGNIEESPIKTNNYDGIVKVEETNFREIVKDKNFRYASTKPNYEFPFEGYDYLRYNTLVRTIWKERDTVFYVRNHLPNDESGILQCLKKIYYATPASRDKSLIHSSTINLGGQGILIVGKYRSGKTTLTFKLMEELGASLIEVGHSLISFNNQLIGNYSLRALYARFSTVFNSAYLFPLLQNVDDCEAQQPIDKDALENIIKSKAFHVDAGLCLSRRKLCDLFGKKITTSGTRIKKIIFPEYSPTEGVKIFSLQLDEAYGKITEREFPKDTGIGKVLHQTKITPPEHSNLNKIWFEDLEFKRVIFSDWNDLTKSMLEDIIS